MLSIQECILTDQISIAKAVEGCDATIWCATGFADETQSKDNDDSPKNESIFAKVLSFFGIDSKDGASNDDSTPPPPPPSSKQSIDIVGIPIIAKLIMQQQKQQTDYPKVVMLSSAGITRPSWDEKKKEQLRGCADIRIVLYTIIIITIIIIDCFIIEKVDVLLEKYYKIIIK